MEYLLVCMHTAAACQPPACILVRSAATYLLPSPTHVIRKHIVNFQEEGKHTSW